LPNSKVSFTSLINYFKPNRQANFLDRLAVVIVEYFCYEKFLDQTVEYLDFIALDYYSRNRLKWIPWFNVNLNKEINKKLSDMGWEIYPAGIYHVLRYLSKFNKPIYIMENRVADADDNKRTVFIINHLKYVHKAISQGIDVRGYFYWSLLDNFEWADGWTPKFGLYAVDRKTFKRTSRPSAKVYAEICKNNEIKRDKPCN